MKSRQVLNRRNGFTLLETVIAIGVLAVLLTGFMVVFAPAAAGIRQSLNVQEADRLTSTLEQELVNLRTGDSVPAKSGGGSLTGFDKAYDWVMKSNGPTTVAEPLLVYQYRGSLTAALRPDGTPTPVASITGKQPGKDYTVVPMVRRKKDTARLNADLAAVEGGVYVVKCTQLVFGTGITTGLILGTKGSIRDPKGTSTTGATVDDYPEAVVAFTADFYQLPSKAPSYIASGAADTKINQLKTPIFSRNLAVRR